MRALWQKILNTAFTTLWLLDHLFGTRKREPFRKARLGLHQSLTRPSGVPNRFEPVPEVKTRFLDASTLTSLMRGGPVLFKGLAKDIPAIGGWTIQSMTERYGHLRQPFMRSGQEYYKQDFLEIAEVMREIEAGKPKHVLYGAGRWNPFAVDPRMAAELSVSSWMDEKFLERSLYRGSHTFISGERHWTPIHLEMGHILSTQACGARRWMILSPSSSPALLPEITRGFMLNSHVYANAARLRDERFGLTGWDCVTEEGDVLFCPLYHWHFVETIRASISVACKWTDLRSLLRHPIMSAFFATSRNPSVISQFIGKDYVPPDFITPLHLRK